MRDSEVIILGSFCYFPNPLLERNCCGQEAMHDESTEWGLGTTTNKNHLNGNLGAKISMFSKEEVRNGLRRKMYSLIFFKNLECEQISNIWKPVPLAVRIGVGLGFGLVDLEQN